MYSPEGRYRPYSSQKSRERRDRQKRPPESVRHLAVSAHLDVPILQGEDRPGPSFPLSESTLRIGSHGRSAARVDRKEEGGRSRREEGGRIRRGEGGRNSREEEPASPANSWRSRGIPAAPGSSINSIPTQVRRGHGWSRLGCGKYWTDGRISVI